MNKAVDARLVTDSLAAIGVPRQGEAAALPLIRKLCDGMAAAGISYCHWKSNNSLERSASGDNDLDLLVDRADGPRFAELLSAFSFKKALPMGQEQTPGVVHYYGYDSAADKLVHIHAHYELRLGHDMTKNYRLPVEKAYLASSVQGDLFRVPAIEFEYVVFVLRMMLKHATWDAILGREGRLNKAERQELAYLQAHIDSECVYALLAQHFPYLDRELFDDCVRAIESGSSVRQRGMTGHRLGKRLQANASRPFVVDVYQKFWRRLALAVRRRVLRSSPKFCLESGGAMVALVGGDGAGKSTAADALSGWLSTDFYVARVHMGKPAWSPATVAIRGVLKVGQLLGLYPAETSMEETIKQESLVSPAYPWLLREVCRARDRYSAYLRARRFAARGGLVILDRFPLAEIQVMDGPLTRCFVGELEATGARGLFAPRPSGPAAMYLVKLEERYYRQISRPELLVVLRLEPEIAVQRKPEEREDFVRERSKAIWEIDWRDTNAYVIDASRPRERVLAELKSWAWSEL